MPFPHPQAERARKEIPRFRRLEEDHSAYEAELEDIERVRHLTPDLEARRMTLKKLKLQAKDEMKTILGSL
ncbi:MAG: DUF465 domain-containing protein [Nitrospirae bacterium CG18_big_fil_WC_8_21_14_2_50_70_55]|nr:MAG: hypothetical protein AUK30_07690 [Nitrospirae bacterium CG2_30_70_394]PIQ06086.1 MAG: DUF465 domain-containing protein [Nitrospirae bacterium CG18_big_fil_WC_8_21_14_2_50_70_55]PIU79987.1 MAG: DUF465 domain-containing protein [Nitrospirae bacterium CG06_land_8_20_14_3_00_70_43]PIW83048.1 MAG: DUF465 domain-containing protein [Nitrospirae bacterium CG_4_8_14_3_um_filter_70_85]PIX82767.1 MAG: DUF465 domain-containing protein [Nitrospirae bacterium CG_4_10_14_3_um_filter_70_108]PJB95343.1